MEKEIKEARRESCLARIKPDGAAYTNNNTEQFSACAGAGGDGANEAPSVRPTFIVNPIAGAGKCEKLFFKAEQALKKRGAEYAVIRTEYAGHAAELASGAIARGERFIVAVGGDGTVSEIAEVVHKKAGVRFGILPFGTGNDFASALGIPTEPESSVALILDGQVKPCDLGEANGRIFTNVCGLGFDVDVLKSVERHSRKHRGMLPYVMGIVDTVLHRKRLRARITMDAGEEMERDFLLVACCNGRRFGGGMLVAPKAVQDDGLFDLVIVDWVGFFKFLIMLPLFVKGKHINKKIVRYIRAREMSVRTEGEFTVQLDGELVERTPLRCRILPGALSIVRP